MPNRSNEEWLAALRRPDEGAQEALAELRAFLRGGLGRALGAKGVGDADLDDFAQDGLLRVLDKLESFRGESRFTTWAMSVSIRVALTALRRKQAPAASLAEIVEPISQAEPPGQAAEREEALGALRRAIDEVLTERQREAILGKLAGLPVVVIADKLGIKSNAFYKLDHDARKKLRRALEAQGFTQPHPEGGQA